MEHFFPEILITYLLPFRQAFSSSGWRYFQGFIVGLLLGYGRYSQKRLHHGGVSGSMIGRFILCCTASLPWLADSQTAVNESMLSLAKLKRCLRRYVIKGLLLRKSASGADL